MFMFHGGGWHSYLQYDDQHPRPSIDRVLLKRVWAYGRPYRTALAGVVITVLFISGLDVVPAVLMREIVDRAIPERDLLLLTWLGAAMLAVPIVSALIGVAQRWWSARAGEGIIFDLRRQLYDHLQRMSLRFFTATRTGELISRLQSDVVGAQQAITGTFVSALSNLVSVLAIVVVMVKADWRLALLALSALPIFVLPARRVARILRRVTDQQMEHNAAMSAILQETFNVSGALLVKLFGRAGEESARFGAEAAQVRDLGVRRAMVGRWFFAALGLVSAIGTAAVFWVGALLVIRGDLSTGTVVMYATLLGRLYGPLSAISNTRVELATSLVSFERVFEVLDLQPDLQEGDLRLGDLKGSITFERVRFRYRSEGPQGLDAVKRFRMWGSGGGEFGPATIQDGTRTWALEDISFEVTPGSLVALVGPSGAGKTTISYLIPRLYDVTEGRVLLDGHDVRSLAFATLAHGIGVVTQETYLFHDTIAANLRYANPRATLEELVEACRAANIDEFIASLPQGYETVVGERGYRLSGGERQRLAIARVILKDPRLLILDEATSHLDSRSEALIQEALERLMVGRTSVVIAHRLSTVLAADKILVLDRGRLVEEGSHHELLRRGGLYAALYETQFRRRPVPA
jgi:ATP-binding cassette subfamily B protein